MSKHIYHWKDISLKIDVLDNKLALLLENKEYVKAKKLLVNFKLFQTIPTL